MTSKFLSNNRHWIGVVVSIFISWCPLVALSQPHGALNFDFVVIGWISEGSIVAKRLSEQSNWSVLVLEPGKRTKSYEFYLVEQTNQTLTHLLRWPRIANERISEHYVRGVPQDYDAWLQKGNDGWGWNDLLPYFKKSVEKGKNSESYMLLGDLNYSSRNLDYKDIENIILSNNRSRLLRSNFTAETNVGYFPIVKRKQIRSMSNYYVISGADPVRINFDASGERVESVDFVIGEEDRTVHVKKELVLSAGAIESAKLLMLSGIGRNNYLKTLDIPVIHNLSIGQNFKDHVTLPLFFTTPVLENLHMEEMMPNFTQTVESLPGPFGNQAMHPLVEFFNTFSDDNSTHPDIQYNYFFIKHHDFKTLKKKWESILYLDWSLYRTLQTILLTKNLLIVQAILLQPKSTGSVELRMNDFMYMPKILANYLDNKEDVKNLLKSIFYIKNKLQDQSVWDVELLRPDFIYAYPVSFEVGNKEDLYWSWYIQHMLMPKLQPVGTVKMGPNNNDSCVSPRLLIHGVKNLRVADASIMPEIPRGDITAATMMIAEKAADLIKKDWMHKK